MVYNAHNNIVSSYLINDFISSINITEDKEIILNSKTENIDHNKVELSYKILKINDQDLYLQIITLNRTILGHNIKKIIYNFKYIIK
jgi:hypothetical protein